MRGGRALDAKLYRRAGSLSSPPGVAASRRDAPFARHPAPSRLTIVGNRATPTGFIPQSGHLTLGGTAVLNARATNTIARAFHPALNNDVGYAP